MRQRILTLISLVACVLLGFGTEPAHAQDSLEHTKLVDGFTLTLSGPAVAEATTGSATLDVLLRDPQQQPLSGATVNVTLLAYRPAESGHGAMPSAPSHDPAESGHGAMPSAPSHDPAVATPNTPSADAGMAGMAGMAEPTSAPPTGMAAMPGMPGMAEPTSATPQPTHAHDTVITTNEHGLVPVQLVAGHAPGTYQGTLSFDQPGTWTVGVVFVVNGQERETSFALTVAQSRPRGLVLGGFAVVNALAIITAAVMRHRKLARHR